MEYISKNVEKPILQTCKPISNKQFNISSKAANNKVDEHDRKFDNDKKVFVFDSIMTMTPIKSKITKKNENRNRNNLNEKSLIKR